jgi:hypothetical protein
MCLLDDLAALIPEHQRQLVSVTRALLADTDTLRTFRPYFITLLVAGLTVVCSSDNEEESWNKVQVRGVNGVKAHVTGWDGCLKRHGR